MILISERTLNFIAHIHNNGCVNRKNQYLNTFQYYAIIWHLRDNGLIYEKKTDHNNQKVWKLTEKGEKVAELLIELRKVMDSE